MYQQFHKAKDVLILLQQTPVKPAYLIVLAIGIIISSLGPEQLITHINHRRTNGKQGKNKEIFDLLFAKCQYNGIIRWSFDATIPAMVVIIPIPVFFPVFFIVFLLKANQIIECKTIVTGYKIDALLRFSVLCGHRYPGFRSASSPHGTTFLRLPSENGEYHP